MSPTDDNRVSMCREAGFWDFVSHTTLPDLFPIIPARLFQFEGSHGVLLPYLGPLQEMQWDFKDLVGRPITPDLCQFFFAYHIIESFVHDHDGSAKNWIWYEGKLPVRIDYGWSMSNDAKRHRLDQYFPRAVWQNFLRDQMTTETLQASFQGALMALNAILDSPVFDDEEMTKQVFSSFIHCENRNRKVNGRHPPFDTSLFLKFFSRRKKWFRRYKPVLSLAMRVEKDAAIKIADCVLKDMEDRTWDRREFTKEEDDELYCQLKQCVADAAQQTQPEPYKFTETPVNALYYKHEYEQLKWNAQVVKKGQNTLRLASFNVHEFADTNVLGDIEQVDPDVLVLIEATEEMMKVQVLLEKFPFHVSCVSGSHGKKRTVLFSKFPLTLPETFSLSGNRCAMKATLPNEMTIVGAHFDASFRSDSLRFLQTQELLLFLPLSSKLIFAGDFNENQNGRYFELLKNYGVKSTFQLLQWQEPKYSCRAGTLVDFILMKEEMQTFLESVFVWHTVFTDHSMMIADFSQ